MSPPNQSPRNSFSIAPPLPRIMDAGRSFPCRALVSGRLKSQSGGDKFRA